MLFSLRFGYYLNYKTASGSVTAPSTSYTAGTAKSYTVTIPIDRSNDTSNVKLNISTDSGNWHSFPCLDLTLDANFTVAVTGSYSSSALAITFYVVNQTGGTVSNTSFTATVSTSIFVAS